jgi:hypothetical protein
MVAAAAMNLVSGCGYSNRSSFLDEFHSIAVTPMRNEIDFTRETAQYKKLDLYYPLVESKLSSSLNDEFLFDGKLKLAEQGTADLVLEGGVIKFSRDGLRYSKDGSNVEEYRLSVCVRLRLKDNRKGNVLWEEPNFCGETSYFITGKETETEDNALSRCLADLSRRVVERVVDTW